MTDKPLVSVIINCYNGEKYLREAIDSVIAQTYENWELVFWDNQSTDSTREIVECYKNPKIRYFYAPEHTPLGEARNLAVEKAIGEYINFLDADDVWMPKKLEKQIALVEPGKVEVVYTDFNLLFEGDGGKKSSMYSYYERISNYHPKDELTVYQNLLIRNWIIFSSVLFNRLLFLSVGGINPLLRQNEDYDILLKCSLRTKIEHACSKLVVYRIHSANNSNKGADISFEENKMIYSDLPPSDDLDNAIKDLDIQIFIHLLRQNLYGKAIVHFIRNCSIRNLFNFINRRR